MPISIGQITIMDFNDAVTLTGFISSNHPKTIKYDGNNETYTPNFPTANLILTPNLFVAGSATDIMVAGTNVQSVTWKRKASNQTGENNLSAGEAMGESFPKALTVSSQPFSATVYSVEYICTIVYRDPVSLLDLTYKSAVTIQKVTDGNNIAIAEITADPGFAFKNNAPASIALSAHLYRGAAKDTTNLTYVWEKLIAGVWTVISGATAVTYTVNQAMVSSLQQFRVKITDTVAADNYYSDPATVLDFNDPIQVVITSSGGDVFKNSVGSSTLTAKLFQNGVEVDAAGSAYTYAWSQLDKNGTVVPAFTGALKTVAIDHTNVDVKGTFICTIS
jgi:hypothetical protein